MPARQEPAASSEPVWLGHPFWSVSIAAISALDCWFVWSSTSLPSLQLIWSFLLVLAFDLVGLGALYGFGRAVCGRLPAYLPPVMMGGFAGGAGLVSLVAILPAFGIAVLGQHGFSLTEPGFLVALAGGGCLGVACILVSGHARLRPVCYIATSALLLITAFWTAYPASRLGVGILAHALIVLSLGTSLGVASTVVGPQKPIPNEKVAIGMGSMLVVLVALSPLIPDYVQYVAYEHSRLATKPFELRRVLHTEGDSSPVRVTEATGLTAPTESVDGVVLIVVDTLRYDFAHDPEIAPNLARFGSEWTSFSRAYVTYPSTLRSTTAMLAESETGEVLASQLRARKTISAAVTSHPHVARVVRDFDRVTEVGEGDLRFQSTSKSALETASRELEYLLTQQEKFVLVIHLLDPHEYYVEHDGYEFGLGKRARYASEVAYVDDLLGEFWSRYRDRLEQHRVATILTSDHGEELGGRNYYSHGLRLIDETVRVPFMINSPGVERGRVDTAVSTNTIPATVLRLLHDSPGEEPPSIFGNVLTPHFDSHAYLGCVRGDRKVLKNRNLNITVEFALEGDNERLVLDSADSVCWK